MYCVSADASSKPYTTGVSIKSAFRSKSVEQLFISAAPAIPAATIHFFIGRKDSGFSRLNVSRVSGLHHTSPARPVAESAFLEAALACFMPISSEKLSACHTLQHGIKIDKGYLNSKQTLIISWERS
jgi:hypothetical protein